MKTFATLLMLSIGMLYSYAQEPLMLSLKKGSDEPTTKSEHFYLVEITNTSKVTTTATITVQNNSCNEDKSMNKSAVSTPAMRQSLMDASKTKQLNQVTVQPGKTVEFYLKLTREQSAQLNTWNCSKIVALSNDSKTLSNELTIESYIPNPKDFN
uniref:hypothetical protein n=2 Tax=Gelidibacter sp. TaxID=2018083 RepID=UPI0040490C93